MNSAAISAETFAPSPPVVYVHSGPTPIMNSTVSDSVNGFLKMRSEPHSV